MQIGIVIKVILLNFFFFFQIISQGGESIRFSIEISKSNYYSNIYYLQWMLEEISLIANSELKGNFSKKKKVK